MKKLLLSSVLLSVLFVLQANAAGGVAGKVIALDAGHGGGETGAVNLTYGVVEADVNWDVVLALEAKLKTQGAYVVVADRLSTRRDRVNDAVAGCASLDIDKDGVSDNRKCDVIVSVHHNSPADATNTTHDGTLTIYTQRSDKPLAQALLSALTPLTGNNEGLLNGGYGMTVYKNLVSSITEAYYITNDCEAELYLYSKGTTTDISESCKDAGYQLENRIDREADLQIEGLANYFNSQSSGGKGGGQPN
ncbi:MAG: N-acetylmuramoyl-L-alanine amidase [bacterium]|nr:N-acetylmuramoyl-L-alanine amidase [bacterium]